MASPKVANASLTVRQRLAPFFHRVISNALMGILASATARAPGTVT
jgi:hypothetical protein